ncbi:site-2 protease family protein [Halomicroarcula sp. F13]|uniref:Site-2 protease family protein n=1 Tax=Haloarcula rubra TaxID=2487747 RepID=A0AAW4PS38_9EURY|nr:site-2 protease family protein [Halomicroarcula rubra]MBX0324086.1 site-2 protease family protein [Halomicroarcula rubra]
MVSTLTWVLAGVVAYTLVAMALKARGVVPDFIRFSGPITTIHTQKGKILLERLARPKRFWRAWTNVGFGVALVVMVGSFLLVVLGAYQAVVDPQPSQLTEPRNVLVIPGVNDFLPLSVAPEIVAGFAITLLVHEGGHGLLCRVGDIDIESMGIASVALVPLGAFVEPDEEGVQKADRGAQARMYVAGVTNNFAVALLCLALLFGPVVGAISVVGGVPIGGTLPQSPADEAGIDSGAVITTVDGQPVANSSELDRRLERAGGTVDVGLRDGETRTVRRSVVVNSAVEGSPLGINQTVVAVNGTEVRTTTQFREAVENRSVATFTLDDGETVTTPVGGYALVAEDGPLAAEGAPIGQALYITSVDGQRTPNASAVFGSLSDSGPGEEVRITGYTGGERQVYDVTLTERSDLDPGIGVDYVARGTSGFTVNDFGIQAYPANTFLALIGGNPAEETRFDSLSFPQLVGASIALPFATAALGFQYNFAGFTGIATNFFTVSGPLSVLGTGGVFLLANLLFWTGWINLVAGQFNLVPTYPLDGGHILRVCSESVVSRLPISNRRRVVTTTTLGISLAMIGSLVFIIAAPQLLG